MNISTHFDTHVISWDLMGDVLNRSHPMSVGDWYRCRISRTPAVGDGYSVYRGSVGGGIRVYTVICVVDDSIREKGWYVD